MRRTMRNSKGNPSMSTTATTGGGGGKTRFTLLSLIAACLISFHLGYVSREATTDVIPATRNLTTDAPSASSSSSSSSLSVDYSMAKKESFGFFDDISNGEWQRLKDKVKSIYPNVLGGDVQALRKGNINTNRFFQDHYEPDFACRHERRIGRLGDGGKWVCDPHRLQAQPSTFTSQQQQQQQEESSTPPPCLVYSVGSNGDTSFEAAVKAEIGAHCEIHSFDMANYTQVVNEAGAHFHQWGIAKTNKVDGRQRVFKTLEATVQELGHVGRTIDIFKIDCEGCEWDIYPSFFRAGVELRQVLIELHGRGDGKKGKFQQIPSPAGADFFESMYRNGYVIFHKEVNIRFWHFGQCIEYAFVKLHRDFFQGIPNFPALESS